MLKLVKHLKNIIFICAHSEQCYEFVSYKFEQRFRFSSSNLFNVSIFLCAKQLRFLLKDYFEKKTSAFGKRTREEIFEKSSRTRHVVACPVREVESARSEQTSIVNPQTLSETAFFRKMPRVFAEGTRVA